MSELTWQEALEKLLERYTVDELLELFKEYKETGEVPNIHEQHTEQD